MGLTKAQSVFNAATPSDADAVAAYLFATARLTSAAVGGNESLRTIAALFDGGGTALTSTLVSGKQALDVNVSGFNISTLNVDGTVADNVIDADAPVKIGSRVKSGALGAITDGKRADALSDVYRRIYVNDSPQVAAKAQTVTVGLTAAALVTALGGRRRILVQNNGAKVIYIGNDATVTADTAVTGGLQVPGNGGTLEIPLGDAVPLFAISGTAGQKVALLEIA